MTWAEKWEAAGKAREMFQTAAPFPHIVIDGFLPNEVAALALKGFPPITSTVWRMASNAHTKRKAVISYGELHCKELYFTPEAMAVFRFLMGAPMLRFLEALTGIYGLVPDPHFVEGGYHCIGPGGYLNIHADFSHHMHTLLERRLNLLLYLNADWEPGYGGELGLYDLDLKRVVTVEPRMNKAVIFATSDISYHGHPEPMTSPPEFLRKSIALYYYSMPRQERVPKKIFFPTDPGFNHG